MNRENISTLSDQELLRLIRAKDDDAVKYMIRLLDRHLRKYLRHRTNDIRYYANLISSITVTILIKQNPPPTLTCKLSTYAIKISHNQWSNMERHIKRNDQQPEEFFAEFEAIEDIYYQTEISDRRKLVNRSLQKLNEKCRNLLTLFCNGYKPDEVYAQLGYSSRKIYQVKKSECLNRLKSIIIEYPEYKELFEGNMEDQ